MSQLQAGNFRNPEDGYVPNTGLQQVSGNGEVGVRKDWGSLDLDYGKFNKRIELQNPSNPFPVPFDDLEYQTLQHDHGKVHSTIVSDLANWDSTLGYDRADRKEFDSPPSRGMIRTIREATRISTGSSPAIQPMPKPIWLPWVPFRERWVSRVCAGSSSL